MKVSHVVRTLWLAAPRPILGRAAMLPLTAAVVLLGGAARMEAQASSGITGTVTDASGAIVPGAAVSILNVSTQITLSAVTSSAGTYAVTGLQPGRYTVTVSAPGFSTTIKNDVTVEVTAQATIDFALNAGSNETVEVSAPLIALNTTQPELGTTIEPIVVAGLPVAIGGGRGRQIDTLQFLAPGTQGDTFSHRVNGGVDFEEEILYNGIPAPQSETAGYSTNFNPPFELINEFRVERSTFSAKYGLAQGAITYQTASGTNALHGDAFYINRNEFFDAKGFFRYGQNVPTDRENDYGFTVGGPVRIPHLYNGKDRTFFLFSLDFAKTALTNSNPGTLPTPAEKAGDFSGFVDNKGKPIPIFDPLTGQQFQYQGRLNVIDPARFSANSKLILPNIPDPDRPGIQSNTSATPNAFPNVNHAWGFTVDHKLTDKQSFHYAEWRNTFSATGFDGNNTIPIDNPLQSTKFQPNIGSVFLLNYVNAVTPNLVATAGVSWIGEINNQFSNSPVANFPAVAASPISKGYFPKINFDGSNATDPFGVGDGIGETQSINRKLGLAFVNNWLWTKGRNTFNIGGEVRRSYQDDNECQNCTGTFNFSQRTTADPANLGATGSSFASFLLGQVDSASRIFANELSLRNLLIAPYIQDDIKLTPKLTANLGLRWDIMLPFREKNDNVVFLNPTQQNVAAGGLPGTAQQFSSAAGGVDRANIHFKNFGPRIGLAYEINEKTVIQAGYNIAYLNGGAYEYGTSKVATTYGNLLQGSFQVSAIGNTTPAYGSWDTRTMPAPPKTPVGPSLGIGTRIEAFDPKTAGIAPYLQQWNFNVQRQLPWNTFLQVAYVGNHALRLPGQLDPPSQGDPSVLLPYGALLKQTVNTPAAISAGIQSPYPNFVNDFGGNATVAHALSPFPQYNQVFNNFDMTGVSNYNGLQASLEKRYSNGLSFLTSYTLSRTLTNADTGFTTFAGQPLNKYNKYPEYVVSNNDVTHNVKVSGTYDLPIGPGRTFLNNKGITGSVIGGIQLGFILQYQTGTPIGPGESNNNPLGCAGCSNRPDRVPGVQLSGNGYTNLGTFAHGLSGRQVFTTAGFASNSGLLNPRLGTAYRNYSEIRNPGYYDEDIKAQKKFALGERVTFILEMNYFNLLNRTRFNGPDTNVDDSNYGYVTGGQSNNPRQGQLAGRITF